MKERPILFSAAMVRAILAGTKTQTRRVATPKRSIEPMTDECPYGEPGDRLWVRETFSGPHCMGDAPPSKWGRGSHLWYWADGNPDRGDWTRPKPSIHMPRWASRITLEITGVRVERLQNCSEADAIAEGCSQNHNGYYWGGPHAAGDLKQLASPVAAYRDLWDSINGTGEHAWAANPWVWVVEFKKLEA